MFQIRFQMKKIINSILLAVIITACGGKQKDVKPITEEPKYAVGIGKVLPEGGIVELSVGNPNKITKIYKKMGDWVKEGDILFDMDAVNEAIQVEKNQAALNTVHQNVKAVSYDVELAETKLAQFKQEFETSKRLYRSKAETAQKVFSDSIAYQEQLATVKRQKQNLVAQQASLKEQQLSIKSSQVTLKDQSFKALQAGRLIRFDVNVGQVLSANTVFGELAPNQPLVIEGEMDELYANQIKEGQRVDISLVGQSKVIATGKLSFVGTSLQNKSILYETIGEGTDRRVRRFTVQLESGKDDLLINQKVECKIHF